MPDRSIHEIGWDPEETQEGALGRQYNTDGAVEHGRDYDEDDFDTDTSEGIGEDFTRSRKSSRFAQRYEREKISGIGHDIVHTLFNTFMPALPHPTGDPAKISDLSERVNGLTQFIQHPPKGVPQDYVQNQVPGLRNLEGQLSAEQSKSDLSANPTGIAADLGAAAAGLWGYGKGRAKERIEQTKKLFGDR